jgi:hypothetical protein
MAAFFRLMLLGSVLACSAVSAEETGLTIYNGDFAVVRERIPLTLKQGVNTVSHSGLAAHVEPESVMLRDPAGKTAFQILEQNYWSEPLSQNLLFAHFEGRAIQVEMRQGDSVEIKPMRIIRSGYAPHTQGLNSFGRQYVERQQAMVRQGGEPVVEIDGHIRFGLPGAPLFPELPEEAQLEPSLYWKIESAAAADLHAELSYITKGMNWKADYNLVLPEQGDDLAMTGWVTMTNQCGRDFENAAIRLMAGDVSRLAGQEDRAREMAAYRSGGYGGAMAPPVSQQALDEYHLYTLKLPSTLKDRETKQVEFIRTEKVSSRSFYLYKGWADPQNAPYRDYHGRRVIDDRNYGTQSNPKVWVMREFENSEANHLGIPLPAGRLRFYRRDGAGLEFTGENEIDHTPEGKTVRVYTGNAFDITGERRQTDYETKRHGGADNFIEESFEIVLRNHKDEAVEIRVVEELYRGLNWKILASSDIYKKRDSRTMEFRAGVEPDSEKKVTYTVHYSW